MIWTPRRLIGDPMGPIENGITYMRPAAHGAAEEVGERRPHLVRVAPVVGRAGVRRVARADERPVLDARDVARVGPGQEAVGPQHRVEPREGPRLHQALAERLVLGLGAVAPVDGVRLGERRDLVDPVGHGGKIGRGLKPDVPHRPVVREPAARSCLHGAHRQSPNPRATPAAASDRPKPRLLTIARSANCHRAPAAPPSAGLWRGRSQARERPAAERGAACHGILPGPEQAFG